MYNDFGSSSLAICFFDCVITTTIAFPAKPGTILFPRSGIYLNLVSNHKHAVETDSEFADQGFVLFAVSLECLHEFLGTGMSDGTKIFNQLFLRHANSEILNGDLVGGIIGGNIDFQFEVLIEHVLFRKLLASKFLKRVGSVGNQFPDKDFFVLIEGIDHNI